jgi:DUF4097 and DUF4098 domain-containing protein YvlB
MWVNIITSSFHTDQKPTRKFQNIRVVKGISRTVNGRIEVGRNSEVEDLQCVNGSIRLEKEARVRGDIETVNGSVDCAAGVKIDGEINSICHLKR